MEQQKKKGRTLVGGLLVTESREIKREVNDLIFPLAFA